jgi:hypothetical protein
MTLKHLGHEVSSQKASSSGLIAWFFNNQQQPAELSRISLLRKLLGIDGTASTCSAQNNISRYLDPYGSILQVPKRLQAEVGSEVRDSSLQVVAQHRGVTTRGASAM